MSTELATPDLSAADQAEIEARAAAMRAAMTGELPGLFCTDAERAENEAAELRAAYQDERQRRFGFWPDRQDRWWGGA